MFCKTLFVLLLLLLFIILSTTKKETFIGEEVEIYKKNKPVDNSNIVESNKLKDIRKAENNYINDIYVDKMYGLDNDLIITDRCIKMKLEGNPDNFKKNLNNKLDKLSFPYRMHETYTYDYSDLEAHIIQQIKEFYSQHNLEIINGPIYVLLFQAPYLRDIDSKCNVINKNVQYNDYYKKYNDISYNVEKNNCNLPIDIRKTYVLMYILFPTYNKKGQFVYQNWDNIKCNMSDLLKYFQHDKGCFIKCKGSNNKICGCLNTDTPYKARCTGDNIVKEKYIYQAPYQVRVRYLAGWERKTRIEKVKNTCNKRDDKKVKFYHHTSYRGYEHTYGIGSYPRTRETNEYSSAIVGKCVGVDVYSHSNFRGRRLATLQPGRSYYNLDTVGAHDDIDSIKVYYRDPGTSGRAIRYYEPIYKYRTETRYRPETRYRDKVIYDNKLYNYGILFVVNSDKLARVTNGNLSNGINVNIKPYFDIPLDTKKCTEITKNPVPILNIS